VCNGDKSADVLLAVQELLSNSLLYYFVLFVCVFVLFVCVCICVQGGNCQ
jgi:choline-glycine betaine transporter